MVYPRLIPVLLLKQGVIVRSQLFRIHQDIGNPMSTVERFGHWNVDELIVLDISQEDFHDLRRDDLHQKYLGTHALDVLAEIAKVCFMPLTFGGRIQTLEDIRQRLAAGADKVTINSQALAEPGFISRAAERFGSQCVVVSVDALRRPDGSYEVYGQGGSRPTGLDPALWARRAEELGAGEIFLNSIDRDGSAQGYDLDLIRRVTGAVKIPVIACGGVGRYEDLAAGALEGGASAVAAANIFHFFELSYPLAKKACLAAGLAMRPVELGSRWFKREPVYDPAERDQALARRLELAERIKRDPDQALAAKYGHPRKKVAFCQRCVYPSISAAPMEFDAAGVCTGCSTAGAKDAISPADWARRKELLREIVEQCRCRDGSRFDCVIPVSGGKDSYFQAHTMIQEFGLRPLLVTYNGNNWTPAGWRNVHRMKEAFHADHVFYSPSVELLVKLNRLGLMVMGDMNWHAHVGITTLPVKVAVQFGIPLIVWGEHGYLDLCGQFSMADFPEMTYRNRLEHFSRGYEWNYFVGRDGITAQDMWPYQYPSDQAIYDLGLRGVYLGNYVYWEANQHSKLVIEKYGWEPNSEPFDRTYRLFSNLDDMHENGVHDYLKYIKFGYGRCTDHVCKDIRAGLMDRAEGIARVRRYDPVKPRDLRRWLDYVGMSEADFDAISDTFRDPRVWRWEHGGWAKDNLWD